MGEQAQVDQQALRRALGAFATGVTIVASHDEGGAPIGLTANSFTSVSLDPPLVLVCIGEDAASYGAFRVTDRFAVSVLRADQIDAARLFATRGADKFAGAAWRTAVTGAPLLEGAAAWFDCRTHAVTPGGDHAILIGRVVDFGETDAPPLGYHRGAFVEIGDRAGPVQLSALVLRGDQALVRERAGRLALPGASRFGPDSDGGSLLGQIAAAGVAGAQPRPIDAFDIGVTHHVLYRASAPDGATPAPGWRFAPLDVALELIPENRRATATLALRRSAPALDYW